VNTPTLGQSGATTDGNRAVTFNGTSHYAYIPGSAPLNTSTFTAEVWVNVTSGAALRWVAGNVPSAYDQGWWIMIDASNKVLGRVYKGGGAVVDILSTAVIANGSGWHHITFGYDGAKTTLTVDGTFQGSNTDIYVPATAGQRITLGFSDAYNSLYFPGSLDEFAYYNTALSCGVSVVGQSCTAGSQVGKHFAAR
jgi:hypothetical protein